MKRLLGILVLIIALIVTSSVFIHFSNRLMEPSSADKYNSYFKKWDRSIVDFCIQYKQKGLDYLNECFEMFDDTTPPDPGHVKKCSNICPLPSFGAKRLVKTTSILKKGNSLEKFHNSSNIIRQARIRD
jgi:hypothetical protein